MNARFRSALIHCVWGLKETHRDTEFRDRIRTPVCVVIWKTRSLCFARLHRRISTQSRPHTTVPTPPLPACSLCLCKAKQRQCSRDGWRDWQGMGRVGVSICAFRHVFTFPLFPPCPNYFYFGMLWPTKHRAGADRSGVYK